MDNNIFFILVQFGQKCVHISLLNILDVEVFKEEKSTYVQYMNSELNTGLYTQPEQKQTQNMFTILVLLTKFLIEILSALCP